MKYVSYIVFCAILLCCPALRCQSAITLSADDVRFLSGCGVLQNDIKVIATLPRAGQLTLSGILHSNGRECSDLKAFIITRKYLKEFNLPPSECPLAADGYETKFVTPAEAVRKPTLIADDVKFLNGCSVRQDDIQVIHNLPSAGQCKLLVILRKDDRDCNELTSFKNSRDFMRMYTPVPSRAPHVPEGYDIDFLTKAELDYMSKIDEDILNGLLKDLHYTGQK